MKKVKAILAGLSVAVALMWGITFTGAAVANQDTVAQDIQKPGLVAVALEPPGGADPGVIWGA